MRVLTFTLFLLGVLLLSELDSFAQPRYRKFGKNIQLLDSLVRSAKLFTIDYSFNVPLADMADRFGVNSSVGGNVLFKTTKNWLFGVEGQFLFGGNVKEDSLITNLLNNNNFIIGLDGFPAELSILQRGFSVMAKVGKLIPTNPKNPNSGLMILLGGGFLQHKIRLEDTNEGIPQIEGEYAKGYDRLTNGWAIKEFIGYLYLDRRKLVNFYVGVEAIQAFTQGQRSLHFDTQASGTDSRFDMLMGVRIGWVMPIYGRSASQYYVD